MRTSCFNVHNLLIFYFELNILFLIIVFDNKSEFRPLFCNHIISPTLIKSLFFELKHPAQIIRFGKCVVPAIVSNSFVKNEFYILISGFQ